MWRETHRKKIPTSTGKKTVSSDVNDDYKTKHVEKQGHIYSKSFIFQENFLEKFVDAERDCCTICFPDIRNFREDVDIDEHFFDLHILKQQKDEGWFRLLS